MKKLFPFFQALSQAPFLSLVSAWTLYKGLGLAGRFLYSLFSLESISFDTSPPKNQNQNANKDAKESHYLDETHLLKPEKKILSLILPSHTEGGYSLAKHLDVVGVMSPIEELDYEIAVNLKAIFLGLKTKHPYIKLQLALEVYAEVSLSMSSLSSLSMDELQHKKSKDCFKMLFYKLLCLRAFYLKYEDDPLMSKCKASLKKIAELGLELSLISVKEQAFLMKSLDYDRILKKPHHDSIDQECGPDPFEKAHSSATLALTEVLEIKEYFSNFWPDRPLAANESVYSFPSLLQNLQSILDLIADYLLHHVLNSAYPFMTFESYVGRLEYLGYKIISSTFDDCHAEVLQGLHAMRHALQHMRVCCLYSKQAFIIIGKEKQKNAMKSISGSLVYGTTLPLPYKKSSSSPYYILYPSTSFEALASYRLSSAYIGEGSTFSISLIPQGMNELPSFSDRAWVQLSYQNESFKLKYAIAMDYQQIIEILSQYADPKKPSGCIAFTKKGIFFQGKSFFEKPNVVEVGVSERLISFDPGMKTQTSRQKDYGFYSKSYL